MKYNYKCVVSNIGSKRYYKSVGGKWKRITNVAGMKAEKGRRKYGVGGGERTVNEKNRERENEKNRENRVREEREMIDNRDLDAVREELFGEPPVEERDGIPIPWYEYYITRQRRINIHQPYSRIIFSYSL